MFIVMPVLLLHDRLSALNTRQAIWLCFPGVISSIAKSKQIIGCALSDAFFLKFSYFLMFVNIQIDLIILKTYDQQFTLTTKKSLHIIFKGNCSSSVLA